MPDNPKKGDKTVLNGAQLEFNGRQWVPCATVEAVAPKPSREDRLRVYRELRGDIDRRQLQAVRSHVKKLNYALLAYGASAGGAVKGALKARGWTVTAFLVGSIIAANEADNMKGDVKRVVAPFVTERTALDEAFSDVMNGKQ